MAYEELRHTADVALRCTSPTLSGLFAAAAEGLASLIGPPEGELPSFPVSLVAPDPETLLVDWLTELIYHSELSGGTFRRFEVQVSPILELEAQVWPAPLCERRWVVKAATYHGLSVTAGPEGYSAEIVFDT